jgi:hypothetical protein
MMSVNLSGIGAFDDTMDENLLQQIPYHSANYSNSGHQINDIL